MEGGVIMVIAGFTGPYRFLSNFYWCNVEYSGQSYPSAEHAYQAAKSCFPEERERIRTATSPGVAKRLGSKVVLIPNWHENKEGVMTTIVQRKFYNIDLRERLVDTHPYQLLEANVWGDHYWGISNGYGENKLGLILMKIRKEIIDAGI